MRLEAEDEDVRRLLADWRALRDATRDLQPITLYGVRYVPACTRTRTWRLRTWLAARLAPKAPA